MRTGRWWGAVVLAGGAATTAPARDGEDCRTLYGDPPGRAATPGPPRWCGFRPLDPFVVTPPLPPAPSVCAVDDFSRWDDVPSRTRWRFDGERPVGGATPSADITIDWLDDGTGRVTQTERRTGAQHTWTLDAAGDVVEFVGALPDDSETRRWRLRRVAARRVVEVVVEGHARWTLDPVDGMPAIEARWEDGAWRRVQQITRDRDGFTVRVDEDGAAWRLRCDANGRPVPEGAELDAQGRMARAPVALHGRGDVGGERTLAYDAQGRLVCEERPYDVFAVVFEFPAGRPAVRHACAGGCWFAETADLIDTREAFHARSHLRYADDGTLVALDVDLHADGTVDRTIDLAPAAAPDGTWRRIRRLGTWSVETQIWWTDCRALPPAREGVP